MPLLVRHLALLVHDVGRARRFYQTYFGFDADSQWFGDTLFIRNTERFDLALMPGAPPPNPGAFHHFGFRAESADAVRQLHTRLQVDGVPIVEEVEEPNLVSFKCTDPDGYTVEVYFDVTYPS